MPSRTTAQRYMNGSITIGQQLKEMSDDVMQDTLYNDIQTRKCYLYDIYHDNRPNACFGIDGYDEDDCMKYPVECKFIVKTYSLSLKMTQNIILCFLQRNGTHSLVCQIGGNLIIQKLIMNSWVFVFRLDYILIFQTTEVFIIVG